MGHVYDEGEGEGEDGGEGEGEDLGAWHVPAVIAGMGIFFLQTASVQAVQSATHM